MHNTENTYEVGKGKTIVEILNVGFEPFLFDEEYDLFNKLGKIKEFKRGEKEFVNFVDSKMMYLDEDDCYYKWLQKHCPLDEHKSVLECLKKKEKLNTKKFHIMLVDNKDKLRSIHSDRNFKKIEQFRNILLFESDLTRSFGCTDMQHCDDIVSVVTYYTEIFENIIHNGFDYKDKHFVFFTAGAGQTRCKKSTFVSEEKLNENFNKLFCGLSKEDINKQGGMNTNKYLAYTSLCQTNSEIWEGFNIDKAIVVDDIEYTIPNQKVRYIYTESPEDKVELQKMQEELSRIIDELKEIKLKKEIAPRGIRRTKQEILYEETLKSDKKILMEDIEQKKKSYHQVSIKQMDLPIPFTDGFGVCLKKMQTSMIRLPFVKGLVAYIPKRQFKDYCSEIGASIYMVTDIYGKKYSIDDVDYVFTKSQFKMYKYYNNVLDENGNVTKTGWEVYKDNFKKYKCAACKCNVERDVKLNAKTNYQILQTLTTEMTDKEIYQLAKYDINNLNGIGNDVQSMLNVLSANEDKNNKLSYLQKSLILYPEMLKDYYIMSLLKTTKESMIKKFRSGKFNINGAYTFAIPDTLACMQWWFTGERDLEKLGFVGKGEIACGLFRFGEEVDCLRSPHLDHAHCIRKNIASEKTNRWIKSKGIYIGVKDTMSKLLMFDNDGDKLLVHNNKTIISCAKRFQKKYEMIPNYYEMPKANPQEINNTSLFEGIVLAYHHGNIGTPSNEITKVFATLNPNSSRKQIEDAVNIVALRCADVNFTIDFAKTLYKPVISPDVLKMYKKYSKNKLPHFFIYAKNKNKNQVNSINGCNIDRIENVVRCKRIVFKNLIGKYSYKNMMTNPSVSKHTEKAKQIIELYTEIDEANVRKLSHSDISIMDFDEKKKFRMLMEFDSKKQRKLLEEVSGEPATYIADVLVKALVNDINKGTLWRLFGDILYDNLQRNLTGTKICKRCGNRFKYNTNTPSSSKNCITCRDDIKRQAIRKRVEKHRNYA